MRILLIHPGLPERDRRHQFMRSKRLDSLGIGGIVSRRPCLSLLYLASGLQIDGHEVRYAETVCGAPDSFMKPFLEMKPDCVGLTSYTVSWPQTLDAIKTMRAAAPDTVFIAGGFHAYSLGAAAAENPDAPDVVFAGEAEESIREWALAFDDRNSWKNIKGLYLNSGGETVFTGDREPPANLDSLPFPAWELVDLTRYKPAPNDYFRLPNASFIGSRGCPHHCTFCPSTKNVRLRSAENMLEEIGWLKRYHGVKDLIFWDETLFIDPSRLEKLCEGMVERGLDITWSANARVDDIKDTGLLKLMRRAGCRQLLFGLESGVQKNLDTLGKGFTVEQARAAVDTVNRHGILALGMFMFGIPGETPEEAAETIRFSCGLNLSHASFVFFTPYPGTALHEKIKTIGGGALLPDATYDMKAPSFVPDSMTLENLTSLQALAFKSFYLRPKEIWKQIRGNLNRYKFRDGVTGLLTLIFS